jgi:hypothetical protein
VSTFARTTCAAARRVRGPALRRVAVLLLAPALVLTMAPASPASADDAALARAQAKDAAVHVAELRARLAVAEASYARAVQAVGQQLTDSLVADAASEDAARAAQVVEDQRGATARALYQSGGQAAMLSTLLDAQNPTDLATRVMAVQQVLRAGDQRSGTAAAAATQAVASATDRQRRADAGVVTADQLTVRAAAVSSLLDEAAGTLDRLSTRARSLTDAENAARALAAARAQAAAAAAGALGQVQAQAPPAVYLALYRAAAPTCPGISWTLLAAVGQVESGHGRNVGPSSAGAVGPMQFMPATFAIYAVDGDHDGRLDPFAPADAIFTAARYLCANGAGQGLAGVQRALFAYNRAQWYVDLVLAVQSRIEATQQLG